jgi:hypothetical protein
VDAVHVRVTDVWPTVDGWLNVFRMSADDPVQVPDAGLTATHELFGGDDPTAWLATTLDDGLAAMDRTGVERALIGVTTRRPAERASTAVDFGSLEFGLAACRREPHRIRLVSQVHDVS